MNTPDDAFATLNDLVQTAHNGEQVFRRASRHSQDAHLQTLLQLYADDCAGAVAKLQDCVRQVGGETPVTIDDRVDIEGAVREAGDCAVLEACERNEDQAWLDYRRALEARLSPRLRTIVQRQYETTLDHLSRIDQLRVLFEKAA